MKLGVVGGGGVVSLCMCEIVYVCVCVHLSGCGCKGVRDRVRRVNHY